MRLAGGALRRGRRAGAGTASGLRPVTMSGTITCTVHGRYNFTTPLKNGGTTPTNLPYLYLQLINCTGPGTKKGTRHGHRGHSPGRPRQLDREQLRVADRRQPGAVDARERDLDDHGRDRGPDQGRDLHTRGSTTTTTTNLLVIGLPTAITERVVLSRRSRSSSTLYSNASGGQFTGQCGTRINQDSRPSPSGSRTPVPWAASPSRGYDQMTTQTKLTTARGVGRLLVTGVRRDAPRDGRPDWRSRVDRRGGRPAVCHHDHRHLVGRTPRSADSR